MVKMEAERGYRDNPQALMGIIERDWMLNTIVMLKDRIDWRIATVERIERMIEAGNTKEMIEAFGGTDEALEYIRETPSCIEEYSNYFEKYFGILQERMKDDKVA